MTSSRDKDGRTLDRIVELSASDDLPSLEDAREDLRAAGLVPDDVGRSLREQLVAATFRQDAKVSRREFQRRTRERRTRPPQMERKQLLSRIRQSPQAVTFRNADKMSDDDLWDLLCDLEMDDVH